MHGTGSASKGRLLDDLLLKTSRTFAISIPRLPEPLRREVTVAYLLFRIADTLEDATEWATERKIDELGRLAELLRDPGQDAAGRLAAEWSAEPPLADPGCRELLRETAAVVAAMSALSDPACALVRNHTLRTASCMASFVKRSGKQQRLQLANLKELQSYCYAVAGIVGEMLTELFLLECPQLEDEAAALRGAAAEFGEALQLVNILKDSASDVVEGRSYLPTGVARKRVFALARKDLEGARGYIDRLQHADAPRGLLEFTALPVLLARATLDRVEEQGPGAKLTRDEVAELNERLSAALDRGEAAVPALR
jgi:farnesyl-diphosphate farnesyltransferase